MKREIKFRGKRIDNGKWVYGNLIIKIKPTEKDPTFWCSLIQDGALTANEVDPETVGQFTGKTESKNHPMFDDKINLWEDDVFTIGNSKTKFQTMFDDYEWIGVSNEGDDWGLYKYRLAAIKEPIHILGNVHDNPQIFNEAILDRSESFLPFNCPHCGESF